MRSATRIHPTAIVDPSASLGEDVEIGPYAVVGADVEIGDRCRLGTHAVVDGPCRLGADNVLSPSTVLGGPPQDLKYRGERTALEIGARNTIREFVTMNRGTPGGGGRTIVGDDNLFMAYVHVAHDCRIGSRSVLANSVTLAGHVEIGDDAIIGGLTAIHQFARVANHAFIGGCSAISQDALPWVVTAGNRAETHGVNLVGLKRKGVAPEVIRAIKSCYLTLFRSGRGLEEGLAEVEREFGTIPEIRYFLDFVRTSKRGVTR